MSWKLVNRASFVLLSGYVLALAFGTPVVGGLSEKSFGDFTLNWRQSEDVSRRHAYRLLGEESEGFLYPPPYVVWKLVLGKLGVVASGVLWAGIATASLLASFSLMFRMLGLSREPHRWALALVALMAVGYFVEWDLKSLNCNSVYFFLVLFFLSRLHASPRAAGFVLSASVALKLYSVVFLLYLVWKREYRALASAALGLVLFFVLVPGLYWTFPAALAVTRSWIQAVAAHSTPEAPLHIPAYIVSVQRAFLALAPSSPPASVLAVTRFAQALWVGLCGAFFISRKSSGPLPEGAVLMLFPLVLSPMLQPHHGVVALAAALVLMSSSRPALLLLGAVYALTQFGPAGPLRGLGVNGAFFLLVAGLTSDRRN